MVIQLSCCQFVGSLLKEPIEDAPRKLQTLCIGPLLGRAIDTFRPPNVEDSCGDDTFKLAVETMMLYATAGVDIT